MPEDGLDEVNEDEGSAYGPPICSCGVTAIPAESRSTEHPRFVCENPDCEAFGLDIT
jgi:hypothetical protein